MKLAIIAGGIGAAKLVEGVAAIHPPDDIHVIVNVGDDVEMMGLLVCPDFDTITYTLAELVDPVKRWGMKDETFECLPVLAKYFGQEAWFNIGDKDLATHVYRTFLARRGTPLDGIARAILDRLGVAVHVMPCTNDPVRTRIETLDGRVLDFQEYFVKERATPPVKHISFEGASGATPSPAARDALAAADRILICPSNPYLSIDPVLAVPGVRAAIERKRGVTAFVSPVVGGQAIKGPTTKIMRELGIEPSCTSVAKHYRDVASVAVIDVVDRARTAEIEELGLVVSCTDTIMDSLEKRVAVARHVIALLGEMP